MRFNVIIGLIIFLFVASMAVFTYFKVKAINTPPPVTAVTEPVAENQTQPLMTPVLTPSKPVVKELSLAEHLNLKTYEAAAGDLSLCGDDKKCVADAKRMKSWLCADAVCAGTDKSKTLFDCFEYNKDEYSQEAKNQIFPTVCPLIESPSAETRQSFLIHTPGNTEDKLMKYEAALFALKGSAVACEDHIKNYVGAYGPKWDYEWYRALSGCRILARESTREQEEKDFYIWFGVARGLGSCLDIINNEMRNACNDPETYPALKAKFVVFGYAE